VTGLPVFVVPDMIRETGITGSALRLRSQADPFDRLAPTDPRWRGTLPIYIIFLALRPARP